LRTHSVRFLFYLLSLFITSAAAFAGPVRGRVVDPDGRAVPAADVLLVRGGSVVARTATDRSGGFILEAPDEGRYELRVALDGFHARPIPVTGGSEAHDLGTIALSISAVSESVVVSASQVEAPLSTSSSSVTVITGNELVQRQNESLVDALRLVPGLSVASSGGRGGVTSVFPRGGESDYSLVVIDGVQANTFGGGFDFAHLPLVNVERIEIVRGPQSALYGSNAIGSVIRVVTKHGGEPSAHGSVEGGSFGTGRVSAATTGGSGPWDWGTSVEWLASNGMNDHRSSSGTTITNDDYERYGVAAGGGWSRSGGSGLRGDIRYSSDERGFPGPFGSDPGGSFQGVDSSSRGSDDRWLMFLSGSMPLSRRVRTRADIAYARLDGSFVNRFGASESWSRRTTARVQGDFALAGGLDGSAGAELQRERAGGTLITAAGSDTVPIERTLSGFFGEVRWNHAARILVTAGLRAERITRDALAGDPDAFAPRPEFADDTVVSTNPKLSAAWYLRSAGGEFTKLRASAGTGIRAPDAFEIAFTDNPSLKPERSRSVDLGIDHAFLRGTALLEATAFFNRFDDLIVAVGSFGGSSRFRTDNISNARTRGLELAGSARARPNRSQPADIEVRIAYTLLDTEILAVDRGSGAPPPFTPGDRLLRRPKHQIGASLFVEAGRLSAHIAGRGRTRTRDVDPSQGAFGGIFDSPGYAVSNVAVAWKLLPHVALFGRIDNLFNRAYEDVLGFPALGRSALAGFRVATRE
jgi:outer membrane cobalamin receptor